ncbi:MAG TPA: methylated-DNA--[protein]-cysteine S-methyltransferase [Candidatus Paceibacterota bacterium]|nr:methylated-DNA--[protein]-cysteine S-methyltransferase [Candidatus Pacearchaeota archaeon]HRZ50837.1 methylated-DNA--[protein]-cysteine S-methyltransferase [Candidatus Paceibacterota bacterium]HSA36558.1 methylated-DNA--[protein]-cysteine S-methyltransferase [Candidatus Paceibacterota bacterium]
MRLFFYQTAIGKIGIAEETGAITGLFFENDPMPKNVKIAESNTIKEAARQLNAYLLKELKEFSVPLAPKGTNFEQRVWKAIELIPYGKTASYQDVAKNIGNAQSARAVGTACAKNPVLIFIPCHRIIAKNGSFGGYKKGSALKTWLLNLEKNP